MGKTYKDGEHNRKKKFPRVPAITKRSEPFELEKFKPAKHRQREWQENFDDSLEDLYND